MKGIYSNTKPLKKSKFTKEIVPEGSGSIRYGVTHWKQWYNISYPITNKKTYYVSDEPGDFTIDHEEEYEKIQERLANIRALPPTTKESIMQKRQEEIDEWEARSKELEELRLNLTNWQKREIGRCLFGYKHMTGKHYFYLNYCWIQENDPKTKATKDIRPVYRSADNFAFRMIIKAEETSTGICGAKRRRFGWSWIQCADILYDLIFKNGSILFVTKDDKDTNKFWRRFDFMMSKLPDFLKKESHRNNPREKSYKANALINLCKYELGIISDPESDTMSVMVAGMASTIKSLVGDTITKLVVDEVGEIPTIFDVIGAANKALNEGLSRKRAGCIILFGTVGKMERAGHIFKSLWRMTKGVNPFKLMIGFLPGWMGLDLDEFGNEADPEATIKDIKATVKAFMDAGRPDLALEERQQSPLDEEDLFLQNHSEKIWPVHVLSDRLDYLDTIEIPAKYGLFRRNPSSKKVEFVEQDPAPSRDPQEFPDELGYGQVIMYGGYPPPTRFDYNNMYCIGVDPTHINNDKYNEVSNNTKYRRSDISFSALKRYSEPGGHPGMYFQLEYCAQPKRPQTAYEQCFLAAEYLGTKVLVNIEQQKGEAMYEYAIENGYFDNVAFGVGAESGNNRASLRRFGIYASEGFWINAYNKGESFINDHINKEYDRRAIREAMNIGEINTDRQSSRLYALALHQELLARESLGLQRQQINRTESVQFVKVGNTIMPVHNGPSKTLLQQEQVAREHAFTNQGLEYYERKRPPIRVKT